MNFDDVYTKSFAMDYDKAHPRDTLSEDVLRAIQHLYYWQHNPADRSYSFTDLLFILFQKADRSNRERLRKGFPDHFIAYNLWYHHLNQDEFFRYYGCIPKSDLEHLNENLAKDFET